MGDATEDRSSSSTLGHTRKLVEVVLGMVMVMVVDSTTTMHCITM